jgi:hypothetical protein
MKTFDIIPTWEAALRIVSMRLSAAKTRKQMAEAVKIFEETFLPLCQAVDERNAKIRAEKEASLPCGHSSADADCRCTTCGAEA